MLPTSSELVIVMTAYSTSKLLPFSLREKGARSAG